MDERMHGWERPTGDALRPLLESGASYVTLFGWESIEIHDGADRYLALANDTESVPALRDIASRRRSVWSLIGPLRWRRPRNVD